MVNLPKRRMSLCYSANHGSEVSALWLEARDSWFRDTQ
jgi:hypothetical protein